LLNRQNLAIFAFKKDNSGVIGVWIGPLDIWFGTEGPRFQFSHPDECNYTFLVISLVSFWSKGWINTPFFLCSSGKKIMTSTELQSLLQQHNITPREFAIKIGKSEALVKDWLAGRVKISKAYKKIILDKVK